MSSLDVALFLEEHDGEMATYTVGVGPHEFVMRAPVALFTSPDHAVLTAIEQADTRAASILKKSSDTPVVTRSSLELEVERMRHEFAVYRARFLTTGASEFADKVSRRLKLPREVSAELKASAPQALFALFEQLNPHGDHTLPGGHPNIEKSVRNATRNAVEHFLAEQTWKRQVTQSLDLVASRGIQALERLSPAAASRTARQAEVGTHALTEDDPRRRTVEQVLVEWRRRAGHVHLPTPDVKIETAADFSRLCGNISITPQGKFGTVRKSGGGYAIYLLGADGKVSEYGGAIDLSSANEVIRRAADGSTQRSLDLLNRHIEHQVAQCSPSVREAATAAGFGVEHTGGGCLAWRREGQGGTYLLLTTLDADINGDPNAEQWIVGRYDDDGEGSVAVEKLTLAQAVAAASRLPHPMRPDGYGFDRTFLSVDDAIAEVEDDAGRFKAAFGRVEVIGAHGLRRLSPAAAGEVIRQGEQHAVTLDVRAPERRRFEAAVTEYKAPSAVLGAAVVPIPTGPKPR